MGLVDDSNARNRARDLGGSIVAGIVNDQDLVRGAALCKQRVQARSHEALLVVSANDDADGQSDLERMQRA
jgi:hypothetical protein